MNSEGILVKWSEFPPSRFPVILKPVGHWNWSMKLFESGKVGIDLDKVAKKAVGTAIHFEQSTAENDVWGFNWPWLKTS